MITLRQSIPSINTDVYNVSTVLYLLPSVTDIEIILALETQHNQIIWPLFDILGISFITRGPISCIELFCFCWNVSVFIIDPCLGTRWRKSPTLWCNHSCCICKPQLVCTIICPHSVLSNHPWHRSSRRSPCQGHSPRCWHNGKLQLQIHSFMRGERHCISPHSEPRRR